MYKPIPMEEKFQETWNSFFFLGPKVLMFCLKRVPWTGNELTGDDVENCENSRLTLTTINAMLINTITIIILISSQATI